MKQVALIFISLGWAMQSMASSQVPPINLASLQHAQRPNSVASIRAQIAQDKFLRTCEKTRKLAREQILGEFQKSRQSFLEEQVQHRRDIYQQEYMEHMEKNSRTQRAREQIFQECHEIRNADQGDEMQERSDIYQHVSIDCYVRGWRSKVEYTRTYDAPLHDSCDHDRKIRTGRNGQNRQDKLLIYLYHKIAASAPSPDGLTEPKTVRHEDL